MIAFMSTLITPLLLLSIIFIWKDPVHWRYYIWKFVLLLMLLAYSFIPTANADLSRYYVVLDNIGVYSFEDAVCGTTNSLYNDLYIMNAIFWIIAKTGCKGLLPALSVGVVYGIAFYLTCDCAERYNKAKWIKWILILQFLLLPYYNIINNIRNVIAFAIIALAVYREIIQNKQNIVTYILYLSACLVHTFAITVIVVRLFSGLFNANRVLGFTCIAIAVNIFESLYSNITLFSKIPIIYNTALKIQHYLSPEYSETEWAIRVTTEIFYRMGFYANIFFGLSIVIFLICVTLYSKCKKQYKKNEKIFLTWAFWNGAIILSCIPFSIPYYWRYAMLVAMCLGVVFIVASSSTKLWSIFKWIFFISSILISSLQFYELLLCALRTDWIETFFINNPYVIFFNIIKNLIL